MSNAIFQTPPPRNEPVRSYAPGSPERASLKARVGEMRGEKIEIPLIIGGQEVRSGDTVEAVCPHDHGHVLATVHQAAPEHVAQAVEAAGEAWREWSEMPWEGRAAVLLKAADLLAGPWRDTLNGATMLNQSKTAHQAEIDSACELIDFWRFNAAFMRQIYTEQPASSPGMWNRLEHRPLEGFVFAVTPFNFTAIGGNLPTAPALMGNAVLWKPATTAVVSNYYIMRLLEEAGLPPGVINFLPGRGRAVGDPVMARPEMSGVHFTGSTAVFQSMWKTIGDNVASYRSYPRLVGETGGKDFVFAHPSADVESLAVALVRGAFEFQGQKCSAASRAFVPRSLWPRLEARLADLVGQISVGSPLDFRNFMGAVIDASAYRDIMGYIDYAKDAPEADVILGGNGDDSQGYFIEPTVVVARDPSFKLMCEEIFGPVLTIYVYEDDDIEQALRDCDQGSPYALTGAIFARDRRVIQRLAAALRHAAGNFYINDKPTGAVVGQQPFGGGRASGTNDKAGSMLNLLRWVSQRTIKETFVPATDFRYPFMAEE
ncbi:MAG: L-glutamate gamma-semialdehyde dehydrogenase [Acidobacteriota bacterium]